MSSSARKEVARQCRKRGVNLFLKDSRERRAGNAINWMKRIFQKKQERLIKFVGKSFVMREKKSGTFSACEDEPAFSIELVRLAKHVMNLKIQIQI